MHLSEIEIVIAFLHENITGAVIKNIYRSRGGMLFKLYGGSIDQIFISGCSRWIFPVVSSECFEREPIKNREESLRKFMKSQRILSISLDTLYGKMVVFETPYRTLKIPLHQAAIILFEDDVIVWQEKSRREPTPLTKPMHFIEPRSIDAMAYEQLFIEDEVEKNSAILTREKERQLKALRTLHEKIKQDFEKNKIVAQKSEQEALLMQQWFYTFDSKSRQERVVLMSNSGEEQTIELNPTQTIVWNMEQRFKRTKKARRGVGIITKRLESIASDIATIEREGVSVPAQKQLKKQPKKELAHKPYHLYTSAGGTTFLVGKGAKDNDELTMKLSSPHDYWFHVQHAHGSHVIMKISKRKTPTKEQLLQGCMLALFYSKAKKSGRGEVWYTTRKYLRKPKGAPPGSVLITKGKSLFVVIDDAILDGLIKA